MRWRSARGEKQKRTAEYEMLWSGLRHPRFVEVPARRRTAEEVEDYVRRDVARLLAKDHSHPPSGSHAGPAPRGEFGETIENLVTIPEAAQLLGIAEGDVERLIVSGKIRAHGLARLVATDEITHALSELRSPGHDARVTPLAHPHPDGPQSEVPSALGAREAERSG